MELSPKPLNQMNWPRNVQGPISSLPKSNETAESDSTDERLLVQPGTIGCVHGCIRRGLARHRLKLAIHKEGKGVSPIYLFRNPAIPSGRREHAHKGRGDRPPRRFRHRLGTIFPFLNSNFHVVMDRVHPLACVAATVQQAR